MSSEDGPHIFKHFHVSTFTWNVLYRPMHRFRHQLPFQPKRLCQIQETEIGPLPNPLVLRYADATDTEERRARLIVRSQFTSNNSRNRRDKKLGLPAVLVGAGSLRYLDRVSPADRQPKSKLLDQVK